MCSYIIVTILSLIFCFIFSFEIGKSLVQSLLDLAACGTVVAGIKFTGCPDDELMSLLAQM
jgi:hypothetical protein